MNDARVQPLSWAVAAARCHFRRRAASALPWRWDGAIAVLGLTRVAMLDAGTWERCVDALCGYQDRHRDLAEIRYADHCAPALCSELLLRRRPCTEAEFAIDRIASFLRDCPRNPEGALDHLGRSVWSHLYPRSIWVDSLMMYVLVAHRLGWHLRDDALRSFALRQVGVFRRLLQRDDGLFCHAYVPRWGGRVGDGWLRGNGWAALALVEMLELDGAHHELTDVFAPLARALLDHQRPDGLWPTLVDDPGTYAEVSGSALVATALAKAARMGWLPSQVHGRARQTFETIVSRPAGASVPTIPVPRSWYRRIPRWSGQSHGIGASLLLAAELASQVPAHAKAAAPAAAASPRDDICNHR